MAQEASFKYIEELPKSMEDQIEDSIKGCIIGGAIGDALGMPVEGLKEKREDHFLNYQKADQRHPNSHLSPGQFTDDTIQTILLARSLIEKQGFDLFSFGDMLRKWYADNKEDKRNMRWIGKTSKTSLRRLINGTSPFRAGDLDTQSDGSLVRVAPIALFYDDLDVVKIYAEQSSIVTHNSQVAKEACRFFAAAIYHLAQGVEAREAIHFAEGEITEKGLAGMLNYAICGNIQRIQHKMQDKSTNIVDTLPIAIYSFLQAPTNLEEALSLAWRYSGTDTDTTLSLTGQLVGAYTGLTGIPQRFIDGLEKSDELNFVVSNLVNGAKKLYVPFDVETIAERNPDIPRKETNDPLRYVGQYLGYLRRMIFEVIGNPLYVSLSDYEETYIYKNKIDLTFVQKETLSASSCKVILPYSHKDTFKKLMELKRTVLSQKYFTSTKKLEV